MPETASAVVVVKPLTVGVPGVGDPPSPFATWCDWALDGLNKALEGMKKSGEGVIEYHVGSRGLKREGSKSQIDNVAYWDRMARFLCPAYAGLPSQLTGRDVAVRIIERDT